MAGPLEGLRIVEMVGIGPAPFCAMLLADMGAEVIRIDRLGDEKTKEAGLAKFEVLARGRRSVGIDLKKPGAAEAVLQMLTKADALLEGFRPGVMERMGLGPEACLAINPRLVYGRMTGWGQSGRLAEAAGHDINYISVSGVLNAIGIAEHPPVPPINLVGDFGGGGMLLAFGLLCALWEANRSGRGQVVDAAMTEGSSLLMSMVWGLRAKGMWQAERGGNFIDGGAHFYNSYLCADGKHISIGSIEPQFYTLLRTKAGLDDPLFDVQMEQSRWPELKLRLAEIFKKKTRAEWCSLMEGSDVCFAPVLNWDEAPAHGHNKDRGAFVDIAGVTQPAPAPRFSRTPAAEPRPPAERGADTIEVLRDWGLDAERIEQLRQHGVILGRRSA